MKAFFEFDFASPQIAKKALQALEQKNSRAKAISLKLQGSKIAASVEAESFAKLRAICTSLLRCAKIVFDVVTLVSKEGKKRR